MANLVDLKELEKEFWKRVDIRGKDECWEWKAGIDGNGYGFFVYKYYRFKAHRFSIFLRDGDLPDDGLFVCHTCDNPPCVNPNHLWACTPSENVQDAHDRGRINVRKGENHSSSKLTEKDVIEARRLYKTGNYSVQQILDKLNLSVRRNALDKAIRKKNWAWLNEQ